MKSFFKPTKVTWIVSMLLLFIVVSPYFIIFIKKNFPVFDKIEFFDVFLVFSLVIIYLTIWFPTGILLRMGLSVGKDAQEGILAFPNFAGLIIVLCVNITFVYIVACVISKIWYSVKNKFQGQKEKENINLTPGA